MKYGKPKKLYNEDASTCWWNSVLQSLVAIEAIDDYDSIDIPFTNVNQECVNEAIYKIIDLYELSDKFNVTVKDSLKCNSCGIKRITGITPSLDIQLLPGDTIIPPLSSTQLLKGVDCPNENKKTEQQKKTTYIDFSEYIMFTSAAFSGMHRWRTMPSYDISITKTRRNQVTETLIYELRAFIIHRGDNTCGHYYAIVKYNDDEWFLCNDDQIIKLTSRKADRYLQSRNIYMSFYKQC